VDLHGRIGVDVKRAGGAFGVVCYQDVAAIADDGDGYVCWREEGGGKVAGQGLDVLFAVLGMGVGVSVNGDRSSLLSGGCRTSERWSCDLRL
jgi:hypothetical protein